MRNAQIKPLRAASVASNEAPESYLKTEAGNAARMIEITKQLNADRARDDKARADKAAQDIAAQLAALSFEQRAIAEKFIR